MKEVRHYVCEICHTEYNNKIDYEKCEKNHKKIKKVIGAKYLSRGQNLKGYPHKITVELEDGSVVDFSR